MWKMNKTEARNFVTKQFYVPMACNLTLDQAANIVELINFLRSKNMRLRADEHGRVQICDLDFNLIAQNMTI